MDETPVEYLLRLFGHEEQMTGAGDKEQYCRKMLGRYGLEAHAHKIPIRDLSGGQKVR